MLGCCIFGAVDFAAEPSGLTLLFFVSQLPFAAGAVLLARSTEPENVNRASFLGDEDAVLSEMVLRGLVDREDALED